MEPKQRGLSRREALKLAGVTAAFAAAQGSNVAEAATRPIAKLFMTDAGKGKNVLFIHGWACDSNDWSWQLPVFEDKYRTVAVDLRGHGRSEIMPSGSYKPEDFVADIEALLTARSDGGKFILVGHSMGGQIAARVAAKRPDLIGGVVSVDGSLGFSKEAARFFAKTALDLEVEDPGVAAPALFKLAYAPTTEPAFRIWHARRVKGMPADVVRQSFPPLFFGPEQVGVGEASGQFCRTIKVPFYHMCRDTDQAKRMRPWFSHPKSKVDVWKRSGHWIMQDRSKDVTAAAIAWINAL